MSETPYEPRPAHVIDLKEGDVFVDGVVNGCEACAGWRELVVDADRQAVRYHNLRLQADEKTTAMLKDAEATKNGQRALTLERQIRELRTRLAAETKRANKAEAMRNALPVPAEIIVNGIDILEGVQVLLDATVHSMDAGSGFLDYREWCAIRQVGRALGVGDLDELSRGDVYLISQVGYGDAAKKVIARWPDPAAPLTDEPEGTETA